ncbi:MAG: hypothetical protein HY913_02725 [Desulfomonile tiedjei]|nr:hypothetical protein [Desulfomonile tiedjei]
MRQARSDILCHLVYQGIFSCLILSLGLLLPGSGIAETYGIKDPKGVFVPKVTVTVGKKEILIRKTDPQQSFRVIAITLKNRNVSRNAGLLHVEWINADNVAGKPMPLSGPHYNPLSKVFQDSMGKSVALKIVEKTKLDLFAGKPIEDLLSISVNEQPLVSSETASEKDRTVQLGTGRDVSISVNKTAIEFNESNLKKGEILDVDNRSGMDQVIGIELPEKSLLYFQKIIKKFEQSQVPRENWDRFTLGADSGVLVVLIPEPDPALLGRLNGKEILVKVYQGNTIKDTIRVPIKTSPDLRVAQYQEDPKPPSRPETPPQPRPENGQSSPSPTRSEPPAAQAARSDGGLGLWIFQIVNLALLVCLGAYGIFFMLPKIQVLEDRLAKNEMFIHGSREAIREELDEIKTEILKQCETKPSSES